MKRLLTAVCLLALFNVGLNARDVSAADLKRAHDHLKKTSAGFLATLKEDPNFPKQ